MRKSLYFAGMVVVAAFLFVQPSKADNFNTYQISGNGFNVTFTLPQTLTPASVSWNGDIFIQNVAGTLNGGAYNFASIQLGSAGWNGFTNYWAFGSQTKSLAVVANLFTWNSDGTVTLNTGTYTLGDYTWFTGGTRTFTLTIVDPPGGPGTVPTPEPASLILLGAGGLAVGALRRRKTS